MRNVSKKNKFAICFCVLNLMFSCKAQPLDDQLNNVIKTDFVKDVEYSDIEYERSKVTYPVNINDRFSNILKKFISEDSNIDDLCKGGEYQIKYEVKSVNPKFISILKIKSSIFCAFHDYSELSTINLLISNDEKVYRTELDVNNKVNDAINSHEFNDEDCDSNSIDNNRGYLLFLDKKPKMFIEKNELCTDTIDLKNVNMLKFTLVN